MLIFRDDIGDLVDYHNNITLAYRTIIRKMVQDLDLYKQKVKSLELSNVKLTAQMTHFEDKKAALLKLAVINETDKSSLNKTFRKIEFKLMIISKE